ncbi:TPA: 2-hydroxymuconate tautomerase family protein [Staphylococcus aureus]|nr:2-hydroxymuconate tautomerase family protein [Staphylococcus aureus]HAR3401359.1 2-hydroxymuconate tautomerase family protein [Staphylococcus aureus]
MPIVNVKLLEGRSDEQLKNLVSEVEKTTGANRQAIHVVIEEMKPNHYGVAGVRKSDQ